LLTDVVMPEMDGCKLAARLRERQPGLKVVFSSGYAQDVALGQSPHCSGDGFLPKPYNAATLMRSICEVLGERPQPVP
jgi:two-component system cell cycle sensor histidine kinase/response regulator CckA